MKLSKEELEKTAIQLSDQVEAIFKEKDCERWIEIFISKDTLVVEAQTMWFQGLLQKEELQKLTYLMEYYAFQDNNIMLRCTLQFDFRSYDSMIEKYEYTFEMMDGLWKIAWLEKIPVSYSGEKDSNYFKFDFTALDNNLDRDMDWSDKSLLAKIEKCKEPLSSDYYLRAVGRSIRFRESHPVLESASLLSSIMSSCVIELARQVVDTDLLQSAKNLFHASIDKLKVQLIRADRNNTWVSKFTAPFLGLEELYRLKGKREFISGSCNCIMSVYYGILRLCGFDKSDILQVRFHNHDAILFLLDEQPYYLSVDELCLVGENTLFQFINITKAFNEDFVCSLNGNHYLEHYVDTEVIKKFIEKFKCFVFLENRINLRREIKGNGCKSILDDICICGNEELTEVIQKMIYSRTLSAGIEVSDSSYVWAKYAFQSLYVPMPHVYLNWSLQSPIFDKFCKEVTQLEQCIKQLEAYDMVSIFKESDRIMTADQVLRHHCGDRKSKALFLHSWLTLVRKTENYFIVTESESYCAWNEEGKSIFWNPSDDRRCSKPSGRIMLVLNKNCEYFTAVCKEDEKEKIPEWLINNIN